MRHGRDALPSVGKGIYCVCMPDEMCMICDNLHLHFLLVLRLPSEELSSTLLGWP